MNLLMKSCVSTCARVMVFISVSILFTEAALKADDKIRMPSKIYENVSVMRETDFKDKAYGEYINVEEDVRQYIQLELKRIETAEQTFSGTELYFLGFLYNEVDSTDAAIKALERFISSESSGADQGYMIKARSVLAEACIKEGKFDKAKLLLAQLEAEKAPFLDLMFFDLARGYSDLGDKKQALDFARKALNTMNPELAGFFLEPLITRFLSNDMASAALTLLGNIQSSDPQTLDYLDTRKKQLSMIGKPLPEFEIDPSQWLKGLQPSMKPEGESKVRLYFYWAPWCDPNGYFLDLVNDLFGKYSGGGLVTVCYVGLYGKVIDPEGKEVSVGEQEEKKVVHSLYIQHAIKIPSLFDSGHKLGRKVHVSELPHFLLIDGDDKVRFFQTAGSMDIGLLERTIAKLLDENAAGDSVR